jgi:hypothetical protein
MPRLISLLVFLMIVAAGVPVDAADEATPANQSPAASPVDVDYLVILAFPANEEPYVTTVGTLGQVIGLQPGNEVALALGRWDDELCTVGMRCFIPVSVPASWSVRPEAGARIDPDRGQLSIDPSTPGGSQFTVEAVVEGRDQTVTADVYVYTPEGNPFVGYWQEAAQLTCDNGTEVSSDPLIEELVFAADGSFAVTWMPFESYVDYWGDYTYNPADGTLDLAITGGNHQPDDVDGSGHYALDAIGNLVLTDMWLGTSAYAEGGTPNCGHRFAR